MILFQMGFPRFRHQRFLIFFFVTNAVQILTGGFQVSSQTSDAVRLQAISPSFRIHPGTTTQTEVFIVRSPVDLNLLFASCNTLNFLPFFISEGIYSSSDGGLTWQGNDTCTGELIGFHGGDPGITIDQNGTFILTRLGQSPFSGLYAHYSADHGNSWSAQKGISTDDLERASLATDAAAGSNYAGRSYAVWVRFASPFPLMFSYTDDGARNWSMPVAVNNPLHRSAGGDLAVGPGGELYATWAGVTETSPFREILVGFASSTDGGLHWNVTEEAFPVSGINGILPEKANIRVNGLPCIDTDTSSGPRKGWIYIVTGQKGLLPAGNDPDIILYRSTDHGMTWSTGIRVNQDPLNNGKIQYFPSVHIDKYGAVNVLFYDDRNTTSDSAGVFLARSGDGGDTWTEYEVCDHHFKPVPIGGLGQGYQGDNIDLTSTDQRLVPVWMDNSSGIYQIWTVPLDFSIFYGVESSQSGRPDFRVSPNPAQNYANIEFWYPAKGKIYFRVYDLCGKELANIPAEFPSPGIQRITIDLKFSAGDRIPAPGIYFIRMFSQGRTATQKIIIQ